MDAFESFYRDHLRLVYAVAAARVTDPAQVEDLVQDTFFRAWRHFHRLTLLPPQAQRAWLVRTARNLITDHWRAARHAAPADLIRAAPARPLAERVALRLDVARALLTLREHDRQIVVLRYSLGMNSREIGALLQMPEGTVRFRLKQCRAALAERLAPWDPAKEGTTDA
jgi:RNA polymerase sigma-70 factor (ECF subfamily)